MSLVCLAPFSRDATLRPRAARRYSSKVSTPPSSTASMSAPHAWELTATTAPDVSTLRAALSACRLTGRRPSSQRSSADPSGHGAPRAGSTQGSATWTASCCREGVCKGHTQSQVSASLQEPPGNARDQAWAAPRAAAWPLGVSGHGPALAQEAGRVVVQPQEG